MGSEYNKPMNRQEDVGLYYDPTRPQAEGGRTMFIPASPRAGTIVASSFLARDYWGHSGSENNYFRGAMS